MVLGKPICLDRALQDPSHLLALCFLMGAAELNPAVLIPRRKRAAFLSRGNALSTQQMVFRNFWLILTQIGRNHPEPRNLLHEQIFWRLA